MTAEGWFDCIVLALIAIGFGIIMFTYCFERWRCIWLIAGIVVAMMVVIAGFSHCKKEDNNWRNSMEWISVKESLPKEDGRYLVVNKAYDRMTVEVTEFTTNLHRIDDYTFRDEVRPGWYTFDPEVGYFERTHIAYWMPLPELP